MSSTHAQADDPVRLNGDLDPNLSRWLWLVKMFLAIPHYVVLVFLWIAFVCTTVIAGFAILFTGRYPRTLFDFNVGVLRWNWRVGFYAYAALGTDRYPPFTLARTDYPADFDVAYPEHLSRGLVLVKSWLLAIPHLLIVMVIAGDLLPYPWRSNTGWTSGIDLTAGYSLLNVLVVLAGFFLLITRRYPTTLFGLLVGINRWLYRVLDLRGLDAGRLPALPPRAGRARGRRSRPTGSPHLRLKAETSVESTGASAVRIRRRRRPSAHPPHRQDGGRPDDRADPGDRVQHAIAAACDRQDGRSDRRRERERERAGDVEHAEILCGAGPVGEHVSHECEIDGRVDAEAEPADRHADEESAEVVRRRDHEQCQAVHDRGGENEDLAPAGAVGEPAADEGGGDDDRGLDERARKICCGTSASALPICSSR